MIGMDRETGKEISGYEHVKQSITDILTTPIGSRVMRRTYGSYLFQLIDEAGNDYGRLKIIAAIADAINKWESRVNLESVTVNISKNGDVSANITAKYNEVNTNFQVTL